MKQSTYFDVKKAPRETSN